MILSSAVRAYVCAEPLDMRKSIDGLAALVAPLLGGDAFSGQVFARRLDVPRLPLSEPPPPTNSERCSSTAFWTFRNDSPIRRVRNRSRRRFY